MPFFGSTWNEDSNYEYDQSRVKRDEGNAEHLRNHKFAKDKLKFIFTHVAGELPSSPDSLFQNDKWIIKAPEILDEICAEFGLYGE